MPALTIALSNVIGPLSQEDEPNLVDIFSCCGVRCPVIRSSGRTTSKKPAPWVHFTRKYAERHWRSDLIRSNIRSQSRCAAGHRYPPSHRQQALPYLQPAIRTKMQIVRADEKRICLLAAIVFRTRCTQGAGQERKFVGGVVMVGSKFAARLSPVPIMWYRPRASAAISHQCLLRNHYYAGKLMSLVLLRKEGYRDMTCIRGWSDCRRSACWRRYCF